MTDTETIRDAIDALRATGQDSTADMLEALSAKLAEVEAERDDYADQIANLLPSVNREAVSQRARAEAAEARIAELEAENARLRHEIDEATDPDFIFGAMDNVNDMDVSLDDLARAASRAQLAALKGDRHEP